MTWISLTRTSSVAPRLDARIRTDLVDRARATAGASGWERGADIATARNAHRTNTLAELRTALAGDFTWLEGDVRMRDGEPVLAHGAHDGWSLALRTWLQVGASSGRGLKLDVKQASAIEPMLRLVRDADVPQERLIFNVTGSARARGSQRASLEQLRAIRAAFPDSIMNLDPGPAPYDAATVRAAVRLARQVGGRIMFPLDLEHATAKVVRELRAAGRVAIWNDPRRTPAGDVGATTRRLRAMGVNGMIDLRS